MELGGGIGGGVRVEIRWVDSGVELLLSQVESGSNQGGVR